MLTAKEAHDKSIENYAKQIKDMKETVNMHITRAVIVGSLHVEVVFPERMSLDIIDDLVERGFIIAKAQNPAFYSGNEPMKHIRIEW